MTAENIGPDHAAALLFSWLEKNGATFRFNSEGFLHVDLDGMPSIRDEETAEMIASAVLSLRKELTVLVRSLETLH